MSVVGGVVRTRVGWIAVAGAVFFGLAVPVGCDSSTHTAKQGHGGDGVDDDGGPGSGSGGTRASGGNAGRGAAAGNGGSGASAGNGGSTESDASVGNGGSTGIDGSAGHDGGDAQPGAFMDLLRTFYVNKLDVLFMIDNSRGMADKSALLAQAIPRLARRFVSPNCVDPVSRVADEGMTPADWAAPCPAGLEREFTPYTDIHVGVITSSLGGHGSSTLCVGSDQGTITDQEVNDHAWLMGKRPRFHTPAGGTAPESQGFLDWNPGTHTGQSASGLATTFQAMTGAAGEFGCGLESQLESIYRFLVDPRPPLAIKVENCPGSSEPCAVPSGVDDSLLAQRAAFLRPDSGVVVVMLTDENDCSIRESGQYYYAARDNIILPHGAAVCVTNPNDRCCYSCDSPPPGGCAADASCSTPTPRTQDQPSLRCFNQVRRFGRDFLYPTERYVNALTSPQICTSRADLAPDPASCPDLDGDEKPDIFDNPLFPALLPRAPRDKSLIFLAGIIGVPWQDIQATKKADGSAYDPKELHYLPPWDLDRANAWSVILGNPNPGNYAAPIPPTDNLMVESKDPRGGRDGENPSVALADTTAGQLANPVNGHEHVNPDQDDLQYACIFPLPKVRDCAAVANANPAPGCDCPPGFEYDNNPLCQDKSGAYSTTQRFAKAYPALRELEVLKGLGQSAIVTSICARNTTELSSPDFGYDPAVNTIVDRIGNAFARPCVPITLTPKPGSSEVPCRMLEVRPGPAKACASTAGRSEVSTSLQTAALDLFSQRGGCGMPQRPSCSDFYVCQIDQAGNECHRDLLPTTEVGWCYIDPAANPDDNTSFVSSCPPRMRRLIRFVDPANDTPAPDAYAILSCDGP